MKQEDNELLLKDLCARLQYSFFIHRYSDNADIRIDSISTFAHFLEYSEGEDFKPYLRPMSSMTEEEINEFILISDTVFWLGNKRSTCILSFEQMDWLNKHYFDYRGLIEKGLALEAPADMYI